MASIRDPMIRIAKQALKEHFTNKIGGPIKTPYYQSQLQILYENDFFPWVVSDALKELVEEGFLIVLEYDENPLLKRLKNIRNIKFFAHNLTIKNSTDVKRMQIRAFNIAKSVDRYSSPENSEALGKQLESLVKQELRVQGFEIVDVHTNEYGGRKWTTSNHDLDIIAKHKSGTLVVGVEIKNTLDLMEPDEIDVKIDICEHLKIVPVFAARWLKPYMECIRRQGGFSWIFKTQIYPFGSKILVKDLYEKLSVITKSNAAGHPLQFPITIRNDLPEKSITKFVDWVTKHKDSPPSINTSYRCS